MENCTYYLHVDMAGGQVLSEKKKNSYMKMYYNQGLVLLYCTILLHIT
jgi:hypothetical protein